jgi:thiol:disulfide interchange protein DsbD
LGLILLIYGSLLIIGGASGSYNPLQPLHALAASQSTSPPHQSAFTQIQSMDEFNTQLAQTDKPVMLDFYADWCTDCKIMEKTTFQDPAVLSALQSVTPLQLDMTANSDTHKAMLKQLKVFGPPTILFFDRDGNEIRDYRLVGLIDTNTMQQHLAQLNNR